MLMVIEDCFRSGCMIRLEHTAEGVLSEELGLLRLESLTRLLLMCWLVNHPAHTHTDLPHHYVFARCMSRSLDLPDPRLPTYTARRPMRLRCASVPAIIRGPVALMFNTPSAVCSVMAQTRPTALHF